VTPPASGRGPASLFWRPWKGPADPRRELAANINSAAPELVASATLAPIGRERVARNPRSAKSAAVPISSGSLPGSEYELASEMNEAGRVVGRPGPGRIGGGVFVAVAGPSGVGKDTIINFARERLLGRREFVFVRRIITRDPDGHSEDHDTLAPAAFATSVAAGAFSLVWQAHGLNYALPRSVDADIAGGRVVIANISRQLIDELQQRYANFLLVVVHAHRDVIAQRLRGRGRETDAEIVARLNRIAVEDTVRADAIRLENSGPRERAGERFVSILEAAAADAENG